jgi:hypothetical protein
VLQAALLLGIALAGPARASDVPADGVETAVPDELAAAAPTGEAPAPVAEPGYVSEIERTWFAPATRLETRVDATRRASLQYGVWSLDSAARAVLSGGFPGSPLERAEAAVRLAPDWPAGRMQLAQVIWLEGDAPIHALRTAWGAVLAIGRHLEASVWFAGSGLLIVAAALVGGGLLCIGLAGVLAAPHAAHDLGDLLSTGTPGFARAGLLGGLLLLPFVLGEGTLGLVWVLLVLGCVYGTRRQRVVLALATGAVLLGAWPAARWAGAVLGAFGRDPVAEAAFSTAQGSSLEVDALRLGARAGADPLAARGLALRARRSRSLSAADAHYQDLLESQPDDWVIANNAANVRLDLGHIESALSLYGRAAAQVQSPIVYFNLAQAYGRAFQVEELAETLRRAQTVDAELVAELTQLQGTDLEGFVVDLPLPARLLWERIGGSAAGEPLAAELRAPLAPGRLGGDVRVATGALAAACLLGGLVGRRVRASHWCARCGRRMCPRCEPESGRGAACTACNRLFSQTGGSGSDRALRVERINALRGREQRLERLATGAALVVPGLAGFLARSPGRSLLASLLFVLAGAAAALRHGAVPDPLVAGATAPFVFLHVAGLAALGYALTVATALAARRSL